MAITQDIEQFNTEWEKILPSEESCTSVEGGCIKVHDPETNLQTRPLATTENIIILFPTGKKQKNCGDWVQIL